MNALRKRAYDLENKFVRDQELLFKAEARRNAMIGLWAAATMKKPSSEDYAKEIVALGVERPDAVIDRLHSDFVSAGVTCLNDDLHDRMSALLKQAADEMYSH